MSNTIETIFRAIDQQSATVNRLADGLDRYTDEADDASQSTRRVNDSLSGLKKAALSYLSIQFAKKVAVDAYTMAEYGAQVEFVDKSFKRFESQTGLSTIQMMGRLRKATEGATSDIKLQQQAMQALASGVNFSDLETAMKFVTRVALAEGKNAAQLMQTTITGLVRGSAEYLDDVHIDVMGSKDVVNDAIGQMEKKMNMFSSSAGSAVGMFAQIKAGAENLRGELSKFLLPYVKEIIKAFKDIRSTFTDQQLENWGSSMVFIFKGVLKAGALFLAGVNTIFTGVETIVNANIEYIFWATGQIGKVLKRQAESWSTIISVIPAKFARVASRKLDEQASSLKTFIQFQKEAGEIQKKRTQEGIKAGLKRNEILSNYILGLKKIKALTPDGDGGGGGGGGEDEATIVAETIGLGDEDIKRLKAFYTSWGEEHRAFHEARQAQTDEYRAREKQAVEDIKSVSMGVVSDIAGARSKARRSNHREELDRIDKLNVSEEKKQSLRMKAEEEYQKKQRASAMLALTASVVLGKMDAIGAAISTLRDTKAGPIAKAASAAAIFGIATSYATQMASIGNTRFYNGSNGPISDGSGRTSDSIPITIRNNESVLNPAETAYYNAMKGQQNQGGGNSISMTFNVAAGVDASQFRGIVEDVLPTAMQNMDQSGGLDYDQMTNMNSKFVRA
jgi:hypothetical protein